jgi:hypothetical protein
MSCETPSLVYSKGMSPQLTQEMTTHTIIALFVEVLAEK